MNEVLALFNKIKLDIVKQSVLKPTAPEASVLLETNILKNTEGKRQREVEPIPEEVAEALADCQAKITQNKKVISYENTSDTGVVKVSEKMIINASNHKEMEHMQPGYRGTRKTKKFLIKQKPSFVLLKS